MSGPIFLLSIVPPVVMLMVVIYGLVLLHRIARSLERIADAADRRGPGAADAS